MFSDYDQYILFYYILHLFPLQSAQPHLHFHVLILRVPPHFPHARLSASPLPVPASTPMARRVSRLIIPHLRQSAPGPHHHWARTAPLTSSLASQSPQTLFLSAAPRVLPTPLIIHDRVQHTDAGHVASPDTPSSELPLPPKIVPPFTRETALAKVKFAESAWNSRDPARVSLAYTTDSQWRNRTEFLTGREEIRAFLARKWRHEREYRLRKEMWCFFSDRIAVRFEYEWHDEGGQWWRTHGNELWEFDADGLMKRRDMSANDYKIEEKDRRYRFERE